MKIKWLGGGVTRRLVAEYEWSAETGYEQDVIEEDIAANLLTDPSGLFVAADEEEAEALFSMDESTDESADSTDELADETDGSQEEEVSGKTRKGKRRKAGDEEEESDSLAIFDRALSAGEVLNEYEDEGEAE